MRALTTDLTKSELRPYFLWDEDVSIGELRELLAEPDSPRRDQLLAKMLREARDIGCTPATLAWLLSEITIPVGIALPADVSLDTLREYISALIARLLVLATPK
jgi:hypothetical protein